MSDATPLAGAPPAGTGTIGAAIRQARERVKLSQSALAEKVGLGAAQTVSDIENDRREVKAYELVAFARALNTDIDVLLGIGEHPTEPRVLWRRGSKAADRMSDAQLLDRARRYAQLE